MSGVSKALGVLGPTPAAAAATAFPTVFFVSRLGPATTSASFLGFEEFLDRPKSSSDKGNLAEEVGFEDGECDDTQEQGNKGGELQLDEGKDGKEFLELLLLLATTCRINLR